MIKEIGPNEKVLVLSDIHYPNCDMNEINSIIEKEKPYLIILLGDIITRDKEDYIKFFSNINFPREKIVYVKGDDDVVNADTEVVKIISPKMKITLIHGHQFLAEKTQFNLANLFKKINKNLPPLGFCIIARLFLKTADFIILGHSHALAKFYNCANAGTLSFSKNLYNDRGYIIIQDKVNIKRLQT
ncbi:metallophosphoesterase [Acidianus sulfidivorans JP7]|uniref:Metallophosphoesterase n=1 Tax=Acidianus sulfidivorans JP7 TaxID=619593 RepID=A0A2U9ILL3_9CREN|nr:metallophosphoesterase family protein [Acidianus sulfidivorans]AWR96948.1 metallophosphoesterase [Acidianus sulfidivorans JP7]